MGSLCVHRCERRSLPPAWELRRAQDETKVREGLPKLSRETEVVFSAFSTFRLPLPLIKGGGYHPYHLMNIYYVPAPCSGTPMNEFIEPLQQPIEDGAIII